MTEEPTKPESDEQDYDETWKIGDETMRLRDAAPKPDDEQPR